MNEIKQRLIIIFSLLLFIFSSCQTELDDEAVNNIPFDYNQILHTSYLGAVVERVIDADRHPYHQHVYPYQLVSGFDNNNNRDDKQGDGYNKLGDWHDTVTGEGVIRYNPTEFTGKVMIHCHFLIHEDEGSMAIETIETQEAGGNCTCTGVGLGTGAIIGIVVGCVIVVGLVGYCIYRRRQRSNNAAVLKENAEKASEKESDEEGGAVAAGE